MSRRVGFEWELVFVVNESSKKGSNPYVKCIFCDLAFHGNATRIRAHILGTSGIGVQRCKCPPSHVVETLISTEKQSAERKEAMSRKRKLSTIANQPTISEVIGKSAVKIADEALARFFIAEGIPFRKLESPFFRDMIKSISEVGPCYIAPGKKKLSGTLLCDEYNRVKIRLANQLSGRMGTLTSDGWKSNARRSIVNLIFSTTDFTSLLKVEDVTAERKTGDLAFMFLETEILRLKDQVVQVLTDGGSDVAKARKLIEEKYPKIVTGWCSTHVLDLLVEALCSLDYVKDVFDRTQKLVQFVRNHSILDDAFQVITGLQLLEPAETRFGTNVIMVERALMTKSGLKRLFIEDKAELFYRNAPKKLKEKFSGIHKTVMDERFWDTLEDVYLFLVPVYGLLRITDNSKYEAIGHIFPLMSQLDQFFLSQKPSRKPLVLRNMLMDKWNDLHTELHSVGFLLNPIYHTLKPWKNEDVMKDFFKLLERWVEPSEQSVLVAELDMFIAPQGRLFSSRAAQTYVDSIKKPLGVEEMITFSQSIIGPKVQERHTQGNAQTTEEKNGTILGYWRLFGSSTPKLAEIAVKVFQQVASASINETIWSQYDYIMPKRRNKLSMEKQQMAIYCYANVRMI